MIEKTISILGCGWLGLPLAKAFVQSGFQVKGSSTTPAKLNLLENAGIQPYLIDLKQDLNNELVQEFMQYSDWLIVAVPPKIRSGEGEKYPEMLLNFLSYLEKNRPVKAIFISSTSVYSDLNKVVTEADLPTNLDDNFMLQAEKVMQDFFAGRVTILRFAGLMGPGREPGKFLAGKTNVANGQAPVNMIHLVDCIAIITEIIKQNCLGQFFNACADEHPTRQAFFTKAALNSGLIPPVFSDEPTTGFKIISNEKLKQTLSYSFIHPDPLKLV